MTNTIQIYYHPKKHNNKKRFLFYPLLKRDVMISSSRTRDLNVLEKAVLHLFLVEFSREKIDQTLADIGMKRDMKKAIIRKLQSSGLLEGNRVTEEGRQQIFEAENCRYKSLEQAVIFQDPFTGEVVPFYGKNIIPQRTVRKEWITFNAGDEGEPVEIKGPVLSIDPYHLNKLKKPEVDRIREKCREYSRLNRKPPVYYLELLKNDSDLTENILYVPIEIFLEKNALDWRVADPFGYSLSNYWKQRVEAVYKTSDWQVKRIIDDLTPRSKKEDILKNRYIIEKILLQYDISLHSKTYTYLIETLAALEKSYQNLERHTFSFKTRQQYFENMVLVLEAALDILIFPYINKESSTIFDSRTIYIPEQMETLCKQLKLHPHRKNISKTAIRRYAEEKEGNLWVRIYFLLSLQDSLPRLKVLANQYPEWLNWITKIHEYRNESCHDLNQPKEPLEEEIEKSKIILENSLFILLRIQKKNKVTKISAEDKSKIIGAKNEVRERYNGNDTILEKYLLHLELGHSVEGRKCLEYLLKKLVKNAKPPFPDITQKIQNDTFRDELSVLAKNIGFKSYPKKLGQINKRNIPKNHQKIDKESVGGLCAYILLSGINIKTLADKDPNLFNTVWLIIKNAESHSSRKEKDIDYEEYKVKVYGLVEVFEIYLEGKNY